MHIKHVTIENFKGIKGPLEIDFLGSDGSPRPVTCILGDNGSGKTSVLQAIALTLSLFTRKTDQVTDFRWTGFLPYRINSFGDATVEMYLISTFDQQKTKLKIPSFYDRVTKPPKANGGKISKKFITPSEADYEESRIAFGRDGIITAFDNPHVSHWFQVRAAIQKMQIPQDSSLELLQHFGDVFWFDQNRNIANTSADSSSSHNGSEHPGRDWKLGVGELRKALVLDWGESFNSNGAVAGSFIQRLMDSFNSLFPGTEMVKAGRKPGTTGSAGDDAEILFRRDGKTYELAEMSSGEQAVFPLIYEFVRQEIYHSIVLIDELELHLHPPQQQALLAAIRRLARDRSCQFIVTTHSKDVAGGFPEQQIFRLPKGHSCL